MSINELEKEASTLGISIDKIKQKQKEIDSRTSTTGKKSKLDKFSSFIKSAVNKGWGNNDIIEFIFEHQPSIDLKPGSISSRISRIRKELKSTEKNLGNNPLHQDINL